MTCPIRPLRDRIVVKPKVRELSAILLVENREPFNEGTIVAVGPKVDQVQPGDFIKYGNGDYLDWPTQTVNGEIFQIIQEADIAAVVEAA